MATYVIGQIRVKEQSAWQKYVAQVGKVIEQYGGQVMFRGRCETVLDEILAAVDDQGFEHCTPIQEAILSSVIDGGDAPELCVAILFDNAETAKRWRDSKEYQALLPLRNQGAEVSLVIYDQLN